LVSIHWNIHPNNIVKKPIEAAVIGHFKSCLIVFTFITFDRFFPLRLLAFRNKTMAAIKESLAKNTEFKKIEKNRARIK
jgi:hypothetical protein